MSLFYPPSVNEIVDMSCNCDMGITMYVKTKNDDDRDYIEGYVYAYPGMCIYVYSSDVDGTNTKDSYEVYTDKKEFDSTRGKDIKSFDHKFKKKECDLKSYYIICRGRFKYNDHHIDDLKAYITNLMKMRIKGKSQRCLYGYLLMNCVAFGLISLIHTSISTISATLSNPMMLEEANEKMIHLLTERIKQL